MDCLFRLDGQGLDQVDAEYQYPVQPGDLDRPPDKMIDAHHDPQQTAVVICLCRGIGQGGETDGAEEGHVGQIDDNPATFHPLDGLIKGFLQFWGGLHIDLTSHADHQDIIHTTTVDAHLDPFSTYSNYVGSSARTLCVEMQTR
jgi:hypothetical protein